MQDILEDTETTVVGMPTSPRLARQGAVYPTEVIQKPRTLRGVREITQGSLRVIEGSPSGWGEVAIGTGLRAALIGTGFYITGTRDWGKLASGALVASGLVTLVLFAGHAVASRQSP